MKKGFTLVELLSVIVILGVVSLIVFPVITKTMADSKEKLYQTQVYQLTEAGKKWALEHIKELDPEYVNDSYVPISMLQDLSYLDKDKISNPRDKGIMNGCVVIHYNLDTKNYSYTYQEYTGAEEKNTCSVKTAGYVYQYVGETWQKSLDHATLSAIETILTADPLTASGSGLYEDDGTYYYRGSNVKNYVTIGSDTWRIVSMNKVDRTIKLMKDRPISNSFWDNGSNLLFLGSKDETGTVVPSNALNLLESYYSSTTSSINATIAGAAFTKKLYPNGSWNAGSITTLSNVSDLKRLGKTTTITSKMGLLTPFEYANASIDKGCETTITETCRNDNYLYTLMASTPSFGGAWLMNNDGVSKIWYVNTNGVLDTSAPNSATYALFPVLYVKNTVVVSATGTGLQGTKENPYIFQ